jgi:hypothetical protein
MWQRFCHWARWVDSHANVDDWWVGPPSKWHVLVEISTSMMNFQVTNPIPSPKITFYVKNFCFLIETLWWSYNPPIYDKNGRRHKNRHRISTCFVTYHWHDSFVTAFLNLGQIRLRHKTNHTSMTNTIPSITNGFLIDVHTVLSPSVVYPWVLQLLIQFVILHICDACSLSQKPLLCPSSLRRDPSSSAVCLWDL